MNFDSYFLSFSRLARRSVLFWGHAVTSGVGAFDGLRLRNGGDGGGGDDVGSNMGQGEDGGGLSGPRELGDCLDNATAGAGVGGHGATCPPEIGGVDYFVSSWLFEDTSLGRRAQRKYSERWVNRCPPYRASDIVASVPMEGNHYQDNQVTLFLSGPNQTLTVEF